VAENPKPLHNDAVANLAPLPRLGTKKLDSNNKIFGAIDQQSDVPARLYASATPDSILNIGPSDVQAADGAGRACSSIGAVTPQFAGGSIDFQTGAIVGAIIAMIPAVPVGKYVRAAFSLNDDNELVVNFSAPVSSRGSLADAATLYDSSGFGVGWVDLQSTNAAGKYKTAGSTSNIIENAPGNVPAIFRVAFGAAPTVSSETLMLAINRIVTTLDGNVD